MTLYLSKFDFYICFNLESYICGAVEETYNCQAIYGDFIFVQIWILYLFQFRILYLRGRGEAYNCQAIYGDFKFVEI